MLDSGIECTTNVQSTFIDEINGGLPIANSIDNCDCKVSGHFTFLPLGQSKQQRNIFIHLSIQWPVWAKSLWFTYRTLAFLLYIVWHCRWDSFDNLYFLQPANENPYFHQSHFHDRLDRQKRSTSYFRATEWEQCNLKSKGCCDYKS